MNEPTVYDFSKKEAETKKYDLESMRLVFGCEISDPEPILSQGETLLMSRGNISTIKGVAKSRKTFFVNILVSSFLGLKTFDLISGSKDGIVLIIDSEQAVAHAYKSFKRVYNLMRWFNDNDRIKFIPLREKELEERVEIMKQAIEFYKPSLVVLDGLIDFVNDSNDNVESREFIQTLMTLSSHYNLHVISVLHAGKSNGGQMLGFLGSYSQRKSETVFEVVKDGDVSIVRPNETRNNAFDEWCFKVENGLPLYCGTIDASDKTEVTNAQIRNTFMEILKPDKAKDYKSIVTLYSEYSGKAESTTKKHLAKAVSLRIIVKSEVDGLYRLPEAANEIADDRPF